MPVAAMRGECAFPDGTGPESPFLLSTTQSSLRWAAKQVASRPSNYRSNTGVRALGARITGATTDNAAGSELAVDRLRSGRGDKLIRLRSRSRENDNPKRLLSCSDSHSLPEV